MKIQFTLTDFFNDNDRKYMLAYIEGILIIYIENTLFFNQPNILLAEFAYLSNKWINNIKMNKYTDFIYNSMDYDEPILSILHTHNDYYKINSIWQEKDVKNEIKANIIVNELENYIKILQGKLKENFNISEEEYFDYVLFIPKS